MPGLLPDDLFSPADQEQIYLQGILGGAGGLLSASGASRLPVTMGAALGAGIQGGQQQLNQAQNQLVRNRLGQASTGYYNAEATGKNLGNYLNIEQMNMLRSMYGLPKIPTPPAVTNNLFPGQLPATPSQPTAPQEPSIPEGTGKSGLPGGGGQDRLSQAAPSPTPTMPGITDMIGRVAAANNVPFETAYSAAMVAQFGGDKGPWQQLVQAAIKPVSLNVGQTYQSPLGVQMASPYLPQNAMVVGPDGKAMSYPGMSEAEAKAAADKAAAVSQAELPAKLTEKAAIPGVGPQVVSPGSSLYPGMAGGGGGLKSQSSFAPSPHGSPSISPGASAIPQGGSPFRLPAQSGSAGPRPLVQGLTPAQMKEQEGLGEGAAKTGNEIFDNASKAVKQSALYDNIIAHAEQFNPGRGAASLNEINSWLIRIAPEDVNLQQSVMNYDALQKNVQALVTRATRDTSARAAVQEMQMIAKAFPNADMPIQSIRTLVGELKAVNDYDIAKGDALQRWSQANPNKSVRDFDSAWNTNMSPTVIMVRNMSPADRAHMASVLSKTDQGRAILSKVDAGNRWAISNGMMSMHGSE